MSVIERWKALPRTQQLLLGAGGAVLVLLFWKRKAIMTASTEVVETLLGVKDAAVWAQKLYGVIGTELPQLSTQSKALIIAHAAYESGWGQKAAAAKGTNNIFNITAGSSWRGDTYVHIGGDLSFNQAECARLKRIMELQPNGKMACRIDQVWRKYPTVNAAVRDYWDFLGPRQNQGRYVPARQALEAGDIPTFGQRLFAAGYFTLPAADYIASMTKVVSTVGKFLNMVG